MVYVISIEGKPLMPCKEAKARKLLRDNKAKVIKRTPFTIQLLFVCENITQPITLGIDAGSKKIGISATTETKELYASEVTLRNDIVDNLASRRQFRRTRRNRKTRYRKARFMNRKKSEGWLAHSIRQKIETHLKVVSDVHKILPISKIIVETASFDIQKIKNPEIQGEQYQQGEQLDFWNVREYVLFRDNHVCQHCKGKTKDKILNVHHIESRKIGGDAPNNLITLCETCHKKHHAGEIELKVKRGTSFKDAAFMGIMRWGFYDKLREIYPDVSMTYGYITKNTRIRNELEKSHVVDARCVSGNPQAEPLPSFFLQKSVRKRNRQLHKATISKGGKRKSNQAPKYVHGFQLFDKVLFGNQECFVFGRRSSGYFDLRLLDGSKVHASTSYKKLKVLEKTKTLLIERRRAIPPIA